MLCIDRRWRLFTFLSTLTNFSQRNFSFGIFGRMEANTLVKYKQFGLKSEVLVKTLALCARKSGLKELIFQHDFHFIVFFLDFSSILQ